MSFLHFPNFGFPAPLLSPYYLNTKSLLQASLYLCKNFWQGTRNLLDFYSHVSKLAINIQKVVFSRHYSNSHTPHATYMHACVLNHTSGRATYMHACVCMSNRTSSTCPRTSGSGLYHTPRTRGTSQSTYAPPQYSL